MQIRTGASSRVIFPTEVRTTTLLSVLQHEHNQPRVAVKEYLVECKKLHISSKKHRIGRRIQPCCCCCCCCCCCYAYIAAALLRPLYDVACCCTTASVICAYLCESLLHAMEDTGSSSHHPTNNDSSAVAPSEAPCHPGSISRHLPHRNRPGTIHLCAAQCVLCV